MLPTEIAHSYNQIADRWHSATFPAINGLAQHALVLAQKATALDVGCGASWNWRKRVTQPCPSTTPTLGRV